MILRNCYELNSNLEKETTVGEFVRDVIEKDEKRFFKYYSILLKQELPCRNMIFHYENGVLKSHHSSYCAMDYREYLDYKIIAKYGTGFISLDNIADWEKDYYKNDANKPSVDNNQLSDEDIDRALAQLDKEEKKNRKERERQNKIDKIKYEYNSGNIQLKQLVECVQAMLVDLYGNPLEKINRDMELHRLEDENRRLYSQIKWLEYKMNLLSSYSFNK